MLELWALGGLGVGEGDGVSVELEEPLFALFFLGVADELPLVELADETGFSPIPFCRVLHITEVAQAIRDELQRA